MTKKETDLDSESLPSEYDRLLKVHFASERARNIARSDLCEMYLEQGRRAIGLPDLPIDGVWKDALKSLLREGLTDKGLYIVMEALARSQGLSPTIDVIQGDLTHG